MNVIKSGAKFSSIVGIGDYIKKKEIETGNKYLPLNRGVVDVVNIDLTNIINKIDFNSKAIQQYAPNLGIKDLRNNINNLYFTNLKNNSDNITISSGGMPSLDIIIQIVKSKTIHLPFMYWGSYEKMCIIRQKEYSFYKSLLDFDLSKLSSDDLIFICTPSNPTSISISNNFLLEMIKKITDTGAVVLFDCPYYQLFNNDNLFEEALIAGGDNLIIAESFSKCYGLSGLRLGFICSTNKDFNEELNIRMLYEFNGISSAPQLIINELISTSVGRIIISNFQSKTIKHIKLNIQYLKDNNLLVDEIYKGELPLGIFAVINKTQDFLMTNKIGSVGMDKFVASEKEYYKQFSRICVSVNHELFKEFITKII